MPLFNRISIIGLGLIGSSIARSARKNKICTHISAYNKNPETLKKALNQGIIDTAAVSLEDAVRGADLVILCTPIGSYSTITKKIAPHLAENAIITDVGSVKSSVIKSIEDELLAEHKPHFIPAHPIAGSEKSGLDAGTADLFKGRQTILTPNDECDAKSLEKIKKLWTKLGSNVELMDAKEHDEIYATASHLPHFISFCFANSIRKLEKTDILEITNNIDDCFKSFIRLAGSNPAMWSDIFMYNKEAILNNIKKFYQPPSLASIKNGEQAEQWLTRLIAA
ncbi:MAG: Cyclohexadienyl dehydrogenase, partial [Rickettsiaceae bacterium]|nr:Cyclohexadienyl dehydrogenase [Rickettsiaceae bacterium]